MFKIYKLGNSGKLNERKSFLLSTMMESQ